MRSSLTLLLLLAFLFALPATRAQQQDPQKTAKPDDDVISLETNLVMLNVSVTDPLENYISGLKAEDFKVFEDKAQQKIVSFGFEESPFAVVFLLD
ncbi:MAG: hypothetical protein ACREBD_13520, partial [Blastocatellia bacterium]